MYSLTNIYYIYNLLLSTFYIVCHHLFTASAQLNCCPYLTLSLFLIPVPSSSVPSRSLVCVCPPASLVPVFVRQGEVYFEWLSRLLCEDLGPERWYALPHKHVHSQICTLYIYLDRASGLCRKCVCVFLHYDQCMAV